MSTQSSIGYPGPAFRPAIHPSVASMQARLQTSPNAVQCQWWLAVPNPAFNPISGQLPTGEGQYIRIPQTGNYYAVVSGANMLAKYLPQGEWEASDIMLAFDSTSFPLSHFDFVIPGQGSADTRKFREKQVLVRANNTVAGAGTVTAAGTTVTGIGTAFTTAAPPGAIIAIAGESAIVESVQSNTVLTLAATLAGSYVGISYSLAADTLLYYPVAQLVDVRDANYVYVVGTDVLMASDNKTIVWTNPARCPSQGSNFAVTYDYYPTYEITEYGNKGPVVDGLPVLDVIGAKLWKPQTPQL